MRNRLVLGSLALLPALAVPVMAQPSDPPPVYVCTPSGQVLGVNGSSGTTTVLYSLAGGSFHDCVLGPDARLYISNGTEIRRLTPGAPADAEAIAVLDSAARGLAFNITDLYVATAANGVQKLAGVSDVPSGEGPVSPVAASPLAAAGQGLVFDIEGNLIVASGPRVQSFAPFYGDTGGPTWTAAGAPVALAPRGVAVDTCNQVVFADRSSKTIKRRAVNGTISTIGGLPFGSKDIPQFLEIDSGNRMFIVTAEDDLGANAKAWRAIFPFATTGQGACAAPASSLTQLVSLKSSLTGPGSVAGLLSARALGIAIGPTDYTITHRFTSAACSRVFDFGFHTVGLSFTNCAALPVDDPDSSDDGYALAITAVKSTPAQVEFAGAFVPAPPATIEGMRYSPMGGWIIQYVVDPLAGGSAPSPFVAKYSFFTQEPIATPGVARSASHDPGAVFDESVGTDYWDLTGLGHDPAGERANDWSKRVVYNSGLRASGIFTGFEDPLKTHNPPFQLNSVIKVACRVVDSLGNPVNNGNLRVSVVRTDDPSLPVQPVTSNVQTDNRMAALGNGKYVFYLLTTGYAIGTYQLTVFGDVLPINGPGAAEYTKKQFQISQ